MVELLLAVPHNSLDVVGHLRQLLLDLRNIVIQVLRNYFLCQNLVSRLLIGSFKVQLYIRIFDTLTFFFVVDGNLDVPVYRLFVHLTNFDLSLVVDWLEDVLVIVFKRLTLNLFVDLWELREDSVVQETFS